MMTEGEVRFLLNALKEKLNNSKTTMQAISFTGGVAALEMVLGDDE